MSRSMNSAYRVCLGLLVVSLLSLPAEAQKYPKPVGPVGNGVITLTVQQPADTKGGSKAGEKKTLTFSYVANGPDLETLVERLGKTVTSGAVEVKKEPKAEKDIDRMTIELEIHRRTGPKGRPEAVEEKSLEISCRGRHELGPVMKAVTAVLEEKSKMPVGKKPALVRARQNDAIPPQAADVLDTAIKAYETKLAVIANNLANAQTVGFKAQRVVLEAGPYRHDLYPGVQDSAGEYAPTGTSIGSGSQVGGTQTDWRQGTLKVTGRPLDLAVVGAGFLQVLDPATGETWYTRAGHLSVNANGNLVLGSAKTGRLLEPAISIPNDATAIVVSAEGIVSVKQPGTSELSQIGQIELARFLNPEGLLRRDESLYKETDASGPPTTGNPGQDGFGRFHQNALEQSNVDVPSELRAWRDTSRLLKAIRELRG